MKSSKILTRHAFILDLLCLLLCFALLFLGNKNIIPQWMLITGALIALVALIASIALFVKARKIDREESRRIESEILANAAREDAAAKYVQDVTDGNESDDEQNDYKTDDEQ